MTVMPLFASPEYPLVPTTSGAGYPVHRIFCVGQNYEEHAREMGGEVDRKAPFFFMKDAQHAVMTGATVPYPPGTESYHHEVELYLALKSPLFRASEDEAEAAIWGYGCSLDMTRRDLQTTLRTQQLPWDIAKNVEQSAVLAPLTPAAEMGEIGPQRISLSVNGEPRQDGRLSDLARSPRELLAYLSGYYHLMPGDLVLTGTPAGVGPVGPGDRIKGEIEGLDPVELTLSAAE